ncbi:uncharacterized protein SCHCODRAFT_02023793 [Schizophyllum commune H4-8]|uniref:uncharacterized protein n=1 Tax=Schizophyllum commune (strain H4-8 / FGSC 9210) TaxID=578458 RepID=UPI00215DE29D|nr:uncharacterized protein SCHCODRAFT_02023793 [Schizophyllum commune H4-8]KAI5899920.1 hypothetical protein SCHCODRAFT_02023793 [Schizophyllum commune H4-8]
MWRTARTSLLQLYLPLYPSSCGFDLLESTLTVATTMLVYCRAGSPLYSILHALPTPVLPLHYVTRHSFLHPVRSRVCLCPRFPELLLKFRVLPGRKRSKSRWPQGLSGTDVI